MDKTCEEFEAWAESFAYDTRIGIVDGINGYLDEMTQGAWMGWQAARQSAGQERGEAVALNGITLEQIAAAREVALAATEGPWEWGSTPCPDNETAKRICAENIDATKAPIGEFFEVFTPDGRRTSLVGNGPTSEANARHIAYFAPNNVLVMLDALEGAIAAPTDAQSRIAEMEAQAPIAYLPKWAFPRLERYGHTSAHMTKNVKDKADQYIPVYDRPSENVRRVADLEAGLAEAIASNSQYLRGINDLHQRLTESRERIAGLEAQLAMANDAAAKGDGARAAAGGMEAEIRDLRAQLTECTGQAERMREDIACLVDVWADQLRPERHYTETAFAELMDEAAAKLAALAAEKEQK